MLSRLLAGLLLCVPVSFFAQSSSFQSYCDDAYAAHPEVPKGLLEAVSFVQTRMTYLDASVQESCTGMPRAWGYMGLIANGEGYFNNNLSLVSAKSGIPVSAILADPASEIQGYASAFSALYGEHETLLHSNLDPSLIRSTLLQLSFIPDSGAVNDFARNSEVYEIFKFLNNPGYQAQYNFPAYNFDLRELFGPSNFNVLSSPKIVFTETAISTLSGIQYQPSAGVLKSTQYGPAIFNPAATCNFSSRNGIAVSAITIHTIQGTYAGAISWAQNCSSSVSYHYVIRSSDGQITQMVLEEDKAWHVGSENPYTIGYEHEGYVTQPQWYTEAMYTASADLSRDIVNSGYGIPALRTYYGASSDVTQTLGGCTKIKGHQHYPNQSHTDPGINWNWEKYYRLINNNPTVTSLTAGSGSFYDSGGAAGSYADDERLIWVIEPASISSVSINFTQFSVEQGYDKLFIYDGNSIDANLIGVFTGTTSPGTVTASGGALTLEFRSDCATTGTGWAANWTSTSLDTEPPSSVVEAIPDYQTVNYTVHFTDSDIGAGVAKQYARVSDKTNAAADWHGNADYGYLDESFDLEAASWSEVTGDWNQTNQSYEMTDISQSNSNAAIAVMQDSLHEYLYHWKQTITSTGASQRAGAHFFCDNTSLPNRGNSYFVYLREGTNVAQIYEVINDTWTLQAEDTVVVAENVTYDVKVTYDPEGGAIQVYVDDAFVVEWIDPAPLKTANGFSLRSGGCAVRYDEVSVYQSRYNQLDLSIGGVDSLLRYQSDNGASAAKVATLVVDYLGNWSSVADEEYRIDWTAPELATLNDGISGADIDTIYLPVVSANWNFSDPHSGINHYSFAVGTSVATQDILPWTNAGMVNSINHVLQNPVLGTTYFVHVRTENEAGLMSEFVSDGQILLEEPPSNVGLTENELQVSVYPQPASETLTVTGNWSKATVQLVDLSGKLVREVILHSKEGNIALQGLSSGFYQLIIAADSGLFSGQILIHQKN